MEGLGARWLVLRLLAPFGVAILLCSFRCLAARTCELLAISAVCLCMYKVRVLRALRCDVIAVRGRRIWTSTKHSKPASARFHDQRTKPPANLS